MFSLDDLSYYVPTRGRTHLKDLKAINYMQIAGLLHKTILVCPNEEIQYWKDIYPTSLKIVGIEEPGIIKDLGYKRTFMFKHCPTKLFFMIDDDVSFSNQYDKDPSRKIRIGYKDPSRLHYYLTTHLIELFKKYPAVGIGSSLFANVRPFLTENKLTSQAFGYNREIVEKDLTPAFNRTPLMHDVDWCLTLLAAGHKNIITSYIVVSTTKEALYAEDGGQGIHRTPELIEECGSKLMKIHSGIITRNPRIRLDLHPNSQQGKFMYHWKKAYKEKVNGY